jgi:hypothetical protein
MSQKNKIEAEKRSLTTDFLPSDGASCCGSFDQRLTAAIAFRQGEMSTAIEMEFILKNKDHPQHSEAKKTAVNQLTAGLGLCYLAGMSIKEMMLPWVESMEKAHPEILPHTAEQPTDEGLDETTYSAILEQIRINDQFLDIVNVLYCEAPSLFEVLRRKALHLHADVNQILRKMLRDSQHNAERIHGDAGARKQQGTLPPLDDAAC